MSVQGYTGLSPASLYALAGAQEYVEEHGEPTRFAIHRREADGYITSLCLVDAPDAEAALASFFSWAQTVSAGATYEAVPARGEA